MKDYLSVNEAVANRSDLNGKGVEVEGILDIQPEGYCVVHYPKSERPEKALGRSSGLWIQFGNGSITPNRDKLDQWLGKRVRIHGILGLSLYRLPDGQIADLGSGPCSMWPAFIEPYSLQRVTAEQRRLDGA